MRPISSNTSRNGREGSGYKISYSSRVYFIMVHEVFVTIYIYKDISLSGVMTEEEAFFKSQQLDMIYSQSSVLYEIFPNTQ
jgi:hypothetical protein